MSEKSSKIKEDSTLPACIGTGKPIPPNDCKTCQKHSDYTCKDLKFIKAGGNHEGK